MNARTETKDQTRDRDDAATLGDALRHLHEPAAIGALMTLFAHAANNRLTVILSCLDVLGSPGVPDADLREALELARGASEALTADLADLQAANRRSGVVVERVNLAQAT